MRRAQRYKKNADAVARLHKKLAAQEAKLTRLHEEHEVLRAREDALKALLTSHTALLNVTQPLRQQLAACKDSGGAALATWQAQLKALEQLGASNGLVAAAQLATASTSANGAAPPSPPAAAAQQQMSGPGAAAPQSQAAAAAAAGALLPSWARRVQELVREEGVPQILQRLSNVTGKDLALDVRQFSRDAASPLFRVWAGASNAAADKARLQQLLDKMLAGFACALVTSPNALVELNVLHLDTLEPIADVAGPEHWAFMLGQMRMTKHQMLTISLLLNVYDDHISTLLPRREELMRQQQQSADDTEQQWELLQEVAACQAEYIWSVMSTGNALFGQILEPSQTAAAIVSAYPITPTLLTIRSALQAFNGEPSESPPEAPPPRRGGSPTDQQGPSSSDRAEGSPEADAAGSPTTDYAGEKGGGEGQEVEQEQERLEELHQPSHRG